MCNCTGDEGGPLGAALQEEAPNHLPHFHADSYGYRPNKSALDAVGKARERCWKCAWVLDVDIKGFFDNLYFLFIGRREMQRGDVQGQ